MQKLLCLRLQGQPPDDAVEGTLLAWREALGEHWSEERDAPRVQEGFRVLMRTCTHWPAPADLVAAMPLIASPQHDPMLKLTSEESQRRGLQRCNEILERLGASIEAPETQQ